MNWIKVVRNEQRTVFADDEPRGDTNQVLISGESGTSTFHLDEPRNYQPTAVTRRLSATTRKPPATNHIHAAHPSQPPRTERGCTTPMENYSPDSFHGGAGAVAGSAGGGTVGLAWSPR